MDAGSGTTPATGTSAAPTPGAVPPPTSAPVAPAGRGMQWNAAAWFGAQLGSTAWLAVAVAMLAATDARAAMAVGGLFVLANAFGVYLWSRRSGLDAISGMLALVCGWALTSVAAVHLLDTAGKWSTLGGVGTHNPPARWVQLGIAALAALIATQLIVLDRARR